MAAGKAKGGNGFGRAIGGKTSGSALVTAELKKLTAEELREGGAKYRALLAERDLEDALGGDDQVLGEDSSTCSCIYSNPCSSRRRAETGRIGTRRAHGWKGF